MSGSVNVKIKGMPEVIKALKAFGFNTNKAVDKAVAATAFNVRREAVRSINEPSQGDRVTRFNPKREHVQSKPGDAPNTDQGRLIGSISVSHQNGSQVAHVFTDLDYGALLELVHNRPWLQPALDSQIPDFKQLVFNALKSQIKKAGK